MSTSEDDAPPSQDIGELDCCEVCEGHTGELFHCKACECTFCNGCWKAQAAHKPRKATSLLGITTHEKIKLSILRVVQPAFSSPADDATLETRLAQDDSAAWFGRQSKSQSCLLTLT